jgi:hypothetical protein
VKSGRGDRQAIVRALAQSMEDVGARGAWIIDQGIGVFMGRLGTPRRLSAMVINPSVRNASTSR